jgi:uncharacterized protein
MLHHPITLEVTEMDLAICRLPPDAPLPGWIETGQFVSITRTPDELSVVCSEPCAPTDVICERHWRLLKVKGPLDFSLTGIIVSLVTPLSEAGISTFAISTFDTDYLLVKEVDFTRALELLRKICSIEMKY